MPYPDLHQFVEALDRAGELHRVTVPVSSMLEVSEIADRISKSPAAHVSEHARAFDPRHGGLGGKALLFEDVRTPEGRASMPLLINAYGSYRRMEMALGCEEGGFEALAAKVAAMLKPEPPTGLMGKMRKGMDLAKLAGMAPKVVANARPPCQQVVKVGDEINLFEIPIIKCWPHDGDPQKVGFTASPEQAGTAAGLGRYITLGSVFTIHPDDAGKPTGQPRPSRNIGMYRAQLIDRNHTAMHWHMHHDGARHWRAWCERLAADASAEHALACVSGGMPCAIVLGGQSVLPYAATAPLPPGVSELLFAGFLNGKGIELVPCKTVDLHVPANAEIVIEGYVSTEGARGEGRGARETNIECRTSNVESEECKFGMPGSAQSPTPNLQSLVLEGPFGDHTGFYSLPDRYPVFTVTAITHREHPIYPTTIVGLPPQEDYYLGKATERLFLPLLRTLVPDVIDYDMPMFGSFHHCVFVKIRKEYPLQARRVMHALWGAGQMAWTKMIVVVDADVNVHDHEEVLFHLCANCDPGRDIEIVNGPLDILDHAAPRLGAGHKLGWDATRKIPGEEVNGQAIRDWPEILRMDEATRATVDSRWSEYGFGPIST